MKKFDTAFRGYDKEQVKNYFDNVIKQYELLLNSKKQADKEIVELKTKLTHYENIEETLNHAIMTAEAACDGLKRTARIESESLINDAKKNANRIINDALLKAEKIEMNAENLKRNVSIFKRRLQSIIESQMSVIEEIDSIDLRDIER